MHFKIDFPTFNSFISLVGLISVDDVTKTVENDDTLLLVTSATEIGSSFVALLNDVQVLPRSKDLVGICVQESGYLLNDKIDSLDTMIYIKQTCLIFSLSHCLCMPFKSMIGLTFAKRNILFIFLNLLLSTKA